MAIRADSFSSVDEVLGFTRHLLDGKPTFDNYTRPTKTELEKFIDRASGVLNVALSASGFTPSAVYNNSTSKLACDDWVTQCAVRYAELTQRGTGYSADEGSRTEAFTPEDARQFVSQMASGFINLGVSQSIKMSDGLAFTGMTAQANRDDPGDTTKEQPLFGRRNFDNE